MAPRRTDRTEHGTRSGRFRGPTAGQKIILAESATVYRVYNAGETNYTVKVHHSNGNVTDHPLARGCSVDFRIPNGGHMTAEATKQDEIDGLYDVLDRDQVIRSGRFRGKGTDTASIPIVQGRAGRLYCIINSGDDGFELDPSQGTAEPIERECSRDVLLATQSLSIKGSNAKLVSGIYDLLTPRVIVRSGRFRYTEQTPTEHTIVDFSAVPSEMTLQRYRITNAGHAPFDVRASGPGTLARLHRNQSLDLQVSGTIHAQITVLATAAGQITGIFDYLGPA